jgi:hypothetical protein
LAQGSRRLTKLANSNAVKIRFLAARVLVEAGAGTKAQKLSDGLASELQAEPQAYAKVIEGEAALKSGDSRRAIEALMDANGLLDTWIGRFDLGRAYLEAGAFTQADSEFGLHQAPWRGPGTVLGRRADLRLFSTRLLLPRSCARKVEVRGV